MYQNIANPKKLENVLLGLIISLFTGLVATLIFVLMREKPVSNPRQNFRFTMREGYVQLLQLKIARGQRANFIRHCNAEWSLNLGFLGHEIWQNQSAGDELTLVVRWRTETDCELARPWLLLFLNGYDCELLYAEMFEPVTATTMTPAPILVGGAYLPLPVDRVARV